jgi:hypothetical protein
MSLFLQFLIAGGSIYGLWLVSKSPTAGWRWCAFMEIPWIIWAISVDAWGFLVLCLVYAGVYTHNLLKVREHDFDS